MDTAPNREKGDSAAPPRVIKRYANRKLYDTRDSRYVTLQQIAEYVRSGEDVQIIDNTTKEDLTNVTLAQIIYEEEKKGEPEPSSLRNLRTLIQNSGERLMHTLRDGPLGKLVTRRDDEGEDREALETGSAEPKEEEQGSPQARAARPGGVAAVGGRGPRTANKDESRSVRSIVGPAKDAFDQLQKTADDRVRALVATAMTHVRDLQTEVRRLQGRIEELEDRLMKATRRAGRKDSDPPAENP